MTGTELPHPPPPFDGEIERLIEDSTGAPMRLPAAPDDAPNIVLILLDDVGFGSFGTFGGPIPTPTCDKVAAEGLRYNQFHTTALCSPTRAALLTGRNHHAVHMGGIPEGANTFPGYDSVIPRSAASIAEILRLNGYATGCFGKWHLTPAWEQGPAGPFDHWPTGQGFERFYGILGAESSQYEPPVYDQTTPVAPYVGKDDYHFTEDMADEAIRWTEQLRATAPHRPFFMYFSTPAVHTPHHVPEEWIERFKGQFDDGWDALRVRIHQRQLELGVIPPGTALTPRPDVLPSWDDYPDRYKPMASRLMEVFAAFLAHTDHHVGRVLDAIDASGRGDNTLVVYITGDNGASAEATINGGWSAPAFQNGIAEDPEWILERMEDFGSARCENHFNTAWAWALDAPFQWMKQVASHFGGTRNGMAMRWRDGINDAGGLRSQFHHVVDIAPTILAAAGIETPERVNGVDQDRVDGVAMNYTFDDANAESTRSTQYFEMLGNRAIYHDGWIASCFHGRPPWQRFKAMEFDGPDERWELYDIRSDFSQSLDLADEHPDRLAELVELFDREARQNQVYPMRDPRFRRDRSAAIPNALGGATKMTYTRAHVRIPETIVVNLKNCSWRITADIELGAAGAEGVIACQGGNLNGWSLYLDGDGRVTYLYNWIGHEITTVVAPDPLDEGRHEVVAEFDYDGGMGGGGAVTLSVDGEQVGAARLEHTVPIIFSMSGETFDVGCDTGAPVGPYPHLYECTADIIGVTLERLSEPPAEIRRQIAEGEHHAGLASQ